VAASYGLLVERAGRYLNWRYLQCPDVDYYFYSVSRGRRLLGWSVLRQEGDRLIWGDALFDPRHPEAVAALIGEALGRSEHRGTRRLEGWFPPRPRWWSGILERLGLRAEPEPRGLGLIYLPFVDPDPLADGASRFYYTMGDGDLF
jgi:hypothetical protein